MRTWLAGLALTAAASACAGSGSASHPTLTAAQALHEARADGFTGVVRTGGESWHCDAHTSEVGPAQTTGRYSKYKRMNYGVEFGDRRVPPAKDNTGRIGMFVVVLPDARLAARCAAAGIYADEHQPIDTTAAAQGKHTKTYRYKLIAGTTVESHMHKSGLPGSDFPSDGQYETFIAHGRVLALGLAYTEHTSAIVQSDLNRFAAEIAG
jgi:hypothetical protein